MNKIFFSKNKYTIWRDQIRIRYSKIYLGTLFLEINCEKEELDCDGSREINQ